MVKNKATISVSNSNGSGPLSALANGAKCLFNPSDFSIERGVSYAEHKIPGRDRPIMQYINGEAEILKMSLFFDTMANGGETSDKVLALKTDASILLKPDVREYTKKFYDMMNMNSDEHAPQKVSFQWGTTLFEGVLISVSQKFTMFSPTGTPIRATLDLAIKSVSDGNKIKNSPDRTKSRVVVYGDKLFTFSFLEYDNCHMWRTIAEANNIDNPRILPSGNHIKIPAIIN